MDEELRAQLLARRDEDQRVRHLIAPPRDGQPVRVPDDIAEEWRAVDSANTAWLAEVVARHGWPGRTLAGDDGAEAAWLLAQHADHQPEMQRAFLDALRAAVAGNEASRTLLAYLEDRVRVHAGRPQLYGTQFTWADGELRPFPVEDPDRLDERRADAGLDPIAEYAARLREHG
jgi:uncharacterized protein DUF6624